jgi:hypothetical protein
MLSKEYEACSKFCFSYSSALKKEEISSSEMSVDFQRITRSYISDDRTPQGRWSLYRGPFHHAVRY